MERRHFLKLAFGLAAGATAIAASANAAPLPPIPAAPGLAPASREEAEPAVVTQGEVDQLKPEEVHYGHHGHHHWHRHWHRRWHHRWHRWHRRHWRHHRWHRHHY